MKKISALIIVLIFLFSGIVTCNASDNSYYIIENENWMDYKGFSEGLGGVLDRVTQRWGFIDKTGAWAIAPQFKNVEKFINGECKVTTVDGDVIQIDRNGERVEIPKNSNISNASERKVPDNILNMSNCFYKEYYGKYYVVTKNGGTSSLYDKNGEQIVPFGKWDEIAPAATINRMVVGINNKYGIADFAGNILIPLELKKYGNLIEKNGKTVRLVDISKILFDIETLETKCSNATPYFGGNRIYLFEYDANTLTSTCEILDEQLKTITFVEKSFHLDYIGSDLEEGICHIRETNKDSLKFLVFNDGGGIKVKLNNEKIFFDQTPIIQNGRTLVPMRAIFEALGADVEWNGETQTITATNKDVTIQMQIGNNTLTKNGQETKMDVCPQLVNGRTMVPVRAVSDSFNVTVNWDGYTQTVSLFTN